MLKIIILSLCAAVAIGRDSVTVDPGPGSGTLDLKGTGFTTEYCEAKSKECPGTDLEKATFGATARQCHVKCSYNLKCLGVFWDEKKYCHLRAKRCIGAQLKASKGHSYYRLKKDEKCPKDQALYEESAVKYSNTFCLMKGKVCQGNDLYDKPQNIHPLDACLAKCARIMSCSMVDFKDNKCSPKSYSCDDNELTSSPGAVNALRLVQGQEKCPGSRQIECPDNAHPVGTDCKCNAGWYYKESWGRCVKEEKPPPTEAPTPAPTQPPKPKPTLFPLTGSCADQGPHEYCDIVGDCNSAEHVIRNVPVAHLDGCKRACDKECACKAFRLHVPDGNCWLVSAPCNTMDHAVPTWKFHIKAAKGQSCDDAKFGCRKMNVKYCKRPGDCHGHNIRHVPTGLDQCRRLCDQECACKSFFHDNGLGCWLKSIACTRRTHSNTAYRYWIKTPDYQSCDYAIEDQCRSKSFKYCHRFGDCHGHNIHALPLGLNDCKRACDRECSCQAFFHDRGLGCWLKSIACTTMTHHIAAYDYFVKIESDQTCPNDLGKEYPGYKIPTTGASPPLVKMHFDPLTGSCTDTDEAHDYCEIVGDCNSGDHIIRNVPVAHLDGCKRACDKECACKAFRLHAPDGNCWLVSTACSTMDHTVPTWRFHIKAKKGETCEKAKYGCQDYDAGYCKRPGDCAGHNIRHVPVGQDVCRRLCSQECACKAYFHDGGLGCWLKSIACTGRSTSSTAYQYYIKTVKNAQCDFAIEDRCRDAKFKYCHRLGDCHGHNIRSMALGLNDCKRACDRECACQAFFHDRGLGCWLKSIACTTMTHHIAAYDYFVKIKADQSCPAGLGKESKDYKEPDPKVFKDATVFQAKK